MKVNIFSKDFIKNLILKSRKSARVRQHLNLHNSYKDPCQRLMNAIQMNSYIHPHRHSLDPRHETLVAIRGIFALIIFSDDGNQRDRIYFGTEQYSSIYNIGVGVEIPPDTWHTVISLAPDSVLLETKAGEFNPKKAKELAKWAPKENSEEAAAYFQELNTFSLEGINLQN